MTCSATCVTNQSQNSRDAGTQPEKHADTLASGLLTTDGVVIPERYACAKSRIFQ
jgi:hypothetical protein